MNSASPVFCLLLWNFSALCARLAGTRGAEPTLLLCSYSPQSCCILIQWTRVSNGQLLAASVFKWGYRRVNRTEPAVVSRGGRQTAPVPQPHLSLSLPSSLAPFLCLCLMFFFSRLICVVVHWEKSWFSWWPLHRRTGVIVSIGVYLRSHSQNLSCLIEASAVEHWCKSESESFIYENFSLTISLAGVISGVYCERRLTCHCVWRCVTVLEYILVWCESVCGCINVCRAPPAYLQAELANGRIRAAEWSRTLQDASRAAAPGTRAALYLLTRRPPLSPAAACVRVAQTRRQPEREMEAGDGKRRHRWWWWCGRAMRVVAK